MQEWSSNIDYYKLSEVYSIEKANPEEFAVYESVYGDKTYNRFAVKHWDLRMAISLDNPFANKSSYYWIKDGEVRVGGVLLEPNVLSRLFIIPPFTNLYEILKLLKNILVNWSDSNKDVYAYQISPEQFDCFEMLGFWPDKSRRWMMRPTEVFNYAWDKNISIKAPEVCNCEEIARLFYDSFREGIDTQYTTMHNGQGSTYEDYLDEVNAYFEECSDDILREASTLIYNKLENKLIGACLVSCLEEWPLVHTIAVDSSYRGMHLAANMLKKALTVLNSNYPVLRLFVTVGNIAESVYYELGFIPGVEFKKFYLPR